MVKSKLFSSYQGIADCITIDDFLGFCQVGRTYENRFSNQERSEPEIGFPALRRLSMGQLEPLEMLTML